MICGGAVSTISPSSSTFSCKLRKLHHLQISSSSPSTLPLRCSSSAPQYPLNAEELVNDASVTGGSYDFQKATNSLTQVALPSSKKVTLVRHGLSTWNKESRIQGSSNLSVLTETGIMQAQRCQKALCNMPFDRCFSSPISRAKVTAELAWEGRKEPLVFLDSLKEAHLFYLEGMKNEFGGSGC